MKNFYFVSSKVLKLAVQQQTIFIVVDSFNCLKIIVLTEIMHCLKKYFHMGLFKNRNFFKKHALFKI